MLTVTVHLFVSRRTYLKVLRRPTAVLISKKTKKYFVFFIHFDKFIANNGHIFPQEAKKGGEEEVDNSGQDNQDDDLEDDVGRGVDKQDGVQDDENGRCLEEKSEAEIEATRSKKPFYYMVFLSRSLFG